MEIGGDTNGLIARFSSGVNKQIELTVGSVTSPVLVSESDLDSGIYFPAVAQVAVAIAGVQELLLSATGFLVPNVFNVDNTGGSNVRVDSDGTLHRDSSARRTKKNITKPEGLESVHLQPYRFQKKDGGPFVYGLMADDLATEDPLLAVWDDGQVEDYMDRGVLAVLAAKVNHLEAQVAELKAA